MASGYPDYQRGVASGSSSQELAALAQIHADLATAVPISKQQIADFNDTTNNAAWYKHNTQATPTAPDITGTALTAAELALLKAADNKPYTTPFTGANHVVGEYSELLCRFTAPTGFTSPTSLTITARALTYWGHYVNDLPTVPSTYDAYVYNNNSAAWEKFGTFTGNEQYTTIILQITSNPSYYLDGSNRVHVSIKCTYADAGDINSPTFDASFVVVDYASVLFAVTSTVNAVQSGTWTVGITPGTSIANGSKTAPTGTAEAIAASTAVKSALVKALAANTATVYLGASGVTSANGYPLDAGEAVAADVDNLSDLYVISDSASQVVRYLGLV